MNRLNRFAIALFSVMSALVLSACSGGSSYVAPPPEMPLSSLTYSASLTGAQENPPALTAATGTASFKINLTTGELTGSIVTSGLAGTAAHLHLGSAGLNGPVVIPLAETSPGSGTWVVAANTILSTDLRIALPSGSLYANVHSASFPGGQIRGQVGVTTRTAQLTSSQENPGTGSSANGNGILAVEPSGRGLTARLVTTGLAGTAAHIHEGAVGSNGPVIVPLTETAAGSGIWVSPAGATLTASQYQSMLAGNLYFNVHSATSPGGEIRGQIGLDVIDVTLSGNQEVPPVASLETATARILVDPITLVASGTITTSAPAVAAHIHTGAFGVAGPVTFPFAKAGTTSAVWTMPNTTLTATQYRALLVGDMYANVHSATFPGGELRGQIGKIIRTGNLSSAQEVPTNASTATARARADFDPITGSFVANVAITGATATAVHIHTGAIGSNGPVTVGFTQTSPGVWKTPSTAKLTAAQAAAFAADGMYFNAHSATFPGGEIRAQANGRD